MLNTPTKIVCVGRNYAEHARELGNEVPEEPVLFMKPVTSLVAVDQGIDLNHLTQNAHLGSLHFECELCLRIDHRISRVDKAAAMKAIGAVTLGLDLTLRDLQNSLKDQGLPWERAKAFDGACVLGDWVDLTEVDLEALEFTCNINGELRQHGQSSHMLFGLADLVSEISQSFTLLPGDVIMTGTPSGVGPLSTQDQISMRLKTHTGTRVFDLSVV